MRLIQTEPSENVDQGIETSSSQTPPNKRLKLVNGEQISIRNSFTSSSEAPAGYIVLSRIFIDLNILEKSPRISSNLNATTQQFPVLLKRITGSGDAHDGCQLELQQKGPEKRIVHAEMIINTETTNLVDQLTRVKGLGSLDTFLYTFPTVCYQAVLLALPDEQHAHLEVKSLWRDSLVPPPRLPSQAHRALTHFYIGDEDQSLRLNYLSWSPREFYDNVHIPVDSREESADIHHEELQCELYPFQRRAVRWLLRREGVEVRSDGQITPCSVPLTDGRPPKSFWEARDAEGNPCYISKLFQVVSRDVSGWDDCGRSLKGGILAEEMGLGKTVEIIALMCLHRRTVSYLDRQSNLVENGLLESRATLIITPPSILEQWKQEIKSHAPSLSVFHYNGINGHRDISESILAQVVANHDVVLTTYNVLAREVHYAGEAPQRSLRHEKRFESRKTPLVQISWWRVCLDEAQMIDTGVSNAARVARLIPRENAWAVTGTPIRKDVKDLFGLLLFLRYEPFCYPREAWMKAYNEFQPVLQNVISNIALRHSKDHIRNEIRLPPQKRIVITMPFTAIEEQHYNQLFEEMCKDCGLSLQGAPINDDWDPDAAPTVEKMRGWLSRLRQTCLHPEVARKNRRALGISTGPLRTVAEVLEVMIDQNDSLIRAEERAFLLSQLRRGQLLENATRRTEALAIWNSCLERSTEIVQECRNQLEVERVKSRSTGTASDPDTTSIGATSDDESENNSRLGTFRLRLRAAIEVQHISAFFTANAYYQIKTDPKLTEPDSEDFKKIENQEVNAYEAAKELRKEMLTDVSRRVGKLMRVISQQHQKNSFVDIAKMNPRLFSYGLEGRRILERFEDFCEALNAHASQYKEWREAMVKLLVQSLIDEEDDIELEGNEYEASTKHQDEMYVYMEALRVMFADRHDAITGQSNVLISHEIKMGIAQAKRGDGPSPELYLTILNKRGELKPDAKLGSLRGIVSELRSLATSLEWQASGGSARAGTELDLVRRALEGAGHMATEQSKVCSKLEKEVEMFRDTMNHRLEYYRQLQQISDTVAPYDEESVGKPLDDALYASKLKAEKEIDAKLSSLKAKRRYLIHLRGDSGPEDSARMCIICQGNFEIGVLTVCGHKYCKDCLRMWWTQHRTCPICKMHLTHKDFHQITYKPQELLAKQEDNLAKGAVQEDSDQHASNSIYSDISSNELKQIQNVDLDGSYGTKIDTLGRHIIWLREHDPGSKSIVFSQYKNFLGILEAAFQKFKIKTTSVDAKRGIEDFKTDPTVECFLLHAKAHSSGLNLVNSTHVFLCEPLINTAIELQAIARVHRIGQHRATTVWMYLVSDTVEESIYDISVSRRLSHIVQRETDKGPPVSKGSQNGVSQLKSLTETAIDSANSLEIQDANLANLMSSGSSGGEMVKKDDLWECLFGEASKKKSPSASSVEAEREVDRFLRGEAAELRNGSHT